MNNPTDILLQRRLKSDQASYKFNNIISFITNNSTVGLHHVFSVCIIAHTWRCPKLYAHITP